MCFFFKQKTAYDMRISDWSSDVCSSDLYRGHARRAAVLHLHAGHEVGVVGQRVRAHVLELLLADHADRRGHFAHVLDALVGGDDHGIEVGGAGSRGSDVRSRGSFGLLGQRGTGGRESHGGADGEEIGRAPSELQSLMRISYAVFCLTKKKAMKQHKKQYEMIR